MAPPQELVKLSHAEDAFLAELIKGRKLSLEVSIPEDIEPDTAVRTVRSYCSMLKKLERAGNQVGLALGRIMDIASRNPEIYRHGGYKTLQEFEESEILDKIGRATLWDYKKISAAMPEQPLERLAKMPKGNLLDAAKVIEGKSPKQREEILSKAEELPNAPFREWLGKSAHADPSQLDGASYLLVGTKEQVDELKAHLEDPRFWAFTGCSERHPLTGVLCAIAESQSEWPAEAEPDIPPPTPIHEEEF